MSFDLFRPYAYLTIRHESFLPQWINWIIPALLATLVVCLVLLLGVNVDVFGGSGLVSKFLGFLQSMPGFYIAALAAIATFNNADMLKVMPGTPPEMKISYNNAVQVVRLTRRRFLSSMFAFLTVSSISLTLISIAALSLAEPIKSITPPVAWSGFKLVFGFTYLLLVAQLIMVTLWGLFYLGERIHTPD